jgi:SAM-dependent methyltransferase
MDHSKRRRSAGWLLDELAGAGRENLDAEHVARYDSKEDSHAAEEVEVLTQLGLNSSSLVVEFGVGTGQFAIAVAPLCERVIAVDVSPPMLARLHNKMGPPNIDTVLAGFVSYEHTGRPADFIYSRYALHHLPDFWKAIAVQRMYDMLKPGGVVRLWDVIYNFEPSETAERIEAWCSTGQDSAPFEPLEHGWGRWELEEHVRDEHSTFTWILEAMFQRVGFLIETAEYSEDSMFAKYIIRRPE